MLQLTQLQLTGCRSPVLGLAAMDPLQYKGKRAGALPWLSQGISLSPILHLSPGCLLAASLPVPAAQALQDPHPNLLTSGQRVEDLSRVLIAPTLGKHHWELTFPRQSLSIHSWQALQQ